MDDCDFRYHSEAKAIVIRGDVFYTLETLDSIRPWYQDFGFSKYFILLHLVLDILYDGSESSSALTHLQKPKR